MKKIELVVSKQNNVDTIRYDLGIADVYDDRAAEKATQLPNVIPFEYSDVDGKRSISAYAHEDTNLETLYKTVLNKKEVYCVLSGIASAFEMGAQGIPVSYIVRDAAYFYVNKTSFAVKCVVMPLKQDVIALAEIPEFFRTVMSNMRYSDEDKDNYVAELITFINQDDFSVSKFKSFIDEKLEKMGLYISREGGLTNLSEGNGAPAPAKEIKVNKLGVMSNMQQQNSMPQMGMMGQAPQPMGMPGQAPQSMGMPGQAPQQVRMPGQAPQPMRMPGQAPQPMGMPGQAPQPMGMPGQAPQPMGMPGQVPQPMGMPGQAPQPMRMPGQAPQPMVPGNAMPVMPEPGKSAMVAPESPKVAAPQPTAPAPAAPQPATPVPVAPQPATPVPMAPQPAAPAPAAPQPAAPVPMAPQPATPAPVAPQAVTPVPAAPQPTAPAPAAPQAPEVKKEEVSPVMPSPVAPQPVKPVIPNPSMPITGPIMTNSAKPLDEGQVAPPIMQQGQNGLLGQFGTKPIPHIVRKKTGEVINITKPEFAIGKSKTKADYAIEDNSAISRVHCIIVQKDGVNYIKDNNSTNHTFINGVELQPGKEVLLKNKTMIQLGDEEFTFLLRKGE